MNGEQFIKAQISEFCYSEAAETGDSIEIMIAIANVLRNRQRAGWFGGNWIDILFSHREAAATFYPPRKPELRDPKFKLLLQQIDDIYSGLALDRMTFGALYYCELHRVENKSFLEMIVRDPDHHPRIANVGQVTFFQ